VPHEPGTWDLVIVAPGFARKLLVGKTIEHGTRTDLGVIELQPGFVIEGRVLDASAQPVAGATVSITEHPTEPADGSLTALAVGNFEATTDSHGRYLFHGVTTLDITGAKPMMVAERGKLRSHPVRVSTGNRTIDVIVLPVGTVEGVNQYPADGARAVLWSTQDRQGFYTAEIMNHRFTIDVPAGDYSIWVRNGKKQVTVVPNATSTVTFP
jgi:hypothetical protein